MIDFLRDLPYKTYTGLFLCSLFATYWLVPKVIWLARGLGLFSGVKSKDGHHSPTLGGLALGIPFIVGISLLLLLRNQVSENMYMVPLQMRGLFLCSCLILVLGFLHDLLNLNRFLLLGLQGLVAVVAYHYGFRLEVAPVADGVSAALGVLALTLIWIVGIVNLVDLFHRLKYLNDLFMSFAALLILSLLSTAYLLDQYRTIVVCCLLMGSIIGYLSHDAGLRPSVGSSGTFFLGLVLAITTLQSQIANGPSGIALLVVGIGLIPFVLVGSFRLRVAPLPRHRQQSDLHLRSLHHFGQAFALKVAATADQEKRWALLCQAAGEFDYLRLVQGSSTGEPIREWGPPTGAGQMSTFRLRCSGGVLSAWGKGTKSDPEPFGQSHFFAALVEVFDRRQESAVLASVSERKNSLRVLLVNRYFAGMSATGQMLSDLAEDLTQQGAAVTVLTGGLSYEAATPISGRNELTKGIHLYRVPATHFGRTNALNRAMDFVFFYLFAVGWILRTPSQRYTHIAAFTDPPLVAIAGYVAKKTKRWKFIYGIQDLYPETALALGILKAGWLFSLCDYINRVLLREADAVVAIGEKMAAHIRGIVENPNRLEVIPNWADGNKIAPAGKEAQQALAKTLNLRDVFTVIYAGNMGLAQEIDALIELLRVLKDRQDIQFLFMGGGVRRRDLAAVVETNQITNAKFIAYQERTSLSEYLALADMGIVTLSAALEGLAIPTRTYSYLAAGLPILAIAGPTSELKIFAEQGLGVHFTPNSIAEIVDFLNAQITQGRRPADPFIRQYFSRHFDRPCRTAKYWALLCDLHR